MRKLPHLQNNILYKTTFRKRTIDTNNTTLKQISFAKQNRGHAEKVQVINPHSLLCK